MFFHRADIRRLGCSLWFCGYLCLKVKDGVGLLDCDVDTVWCGLLVNGTMLILIGFKDNN